MSYGPVIDHDLCIGCNECVEICPANILFEAENPEDPPISRYPDECFYGYSCVAVCPVEGSAIKIVHPLDMRLVVRTPGQTNTILP